MENIDHLEYAEIVDKLENWGFEILNDDVRTY